MSLNLPTSEEWCARCAADGEFKMASRHWNGGLRLTIDSNQLTLPVVDGVVSPGADVKNLIEFGGDEEVWGRVLTDVPPRFNNDLMANLIMEQGLNWQVVDVVGFAQYYAAVMRAVELLRPPLERGEAMPHDNKHQGAIDAPVGRYIHLELEGHDHRIYFEEAGEGIPVLMQHTAGCHGGQWRHLFEMQEITNRFRLIAYDLPFHGKSVPAASRDWWDEPYSLKGEFLRSIPVKLS